MGGFNEEYRHPCIEDIELGLRLPMKKELNIVCAFWYSMGHGHFKDDSGALGEW